jgi:carbonic anhydrase
MNDETDIHDLTDLLERNLEWSTHRALSDPDFFPRQLGGQSPRYFYLGCVDSRVPPNTVFGLEPGDMFVHRNIANLASPHDLCLLAILTYAIDHLKVPNIIVCGHYECGGVTAALTDDSAGLVDHWIAPIRRTRRRFQAELDAIEDHRARVNRLCELSVAVQVELISISPIVKAAWERGQPLAVHGLIYSLDDGHVKDLGLTVTGPAS